MKPLKITGPVTARRNFLNMLVGTAAFVGNSRSPGAPSKDQDTEGAAAARSLNFNQGWRFRRIDDPDPQQSFSDSSFADGGWEVVNVPHSVRLEPENASGMRNFQGICWYRRRFQVDESWETKKIFVEFEGAMQVADVWVNGKHVTTHYGGYTPFTVDLTDLMRFGREDNVLALRLDNSDDPDVPPGKPQHELGFVYFGGLYRNVHLIVTDRLHITDPVYANKTAGGGVFVTYPKVSFGSATINVKVNVRNEHDSARSCILSVFLMDRKQRDVAQFSRALSIPSGEDVTLEGTMEVANPHLWRPYDPYLYALRTEVRNESRVVDQVTTQIGIRSICFNEEGFWINGERLIASGANRHQDFIYVGYALPDSVQYRDIKKLREAGCLSLRIHYPLSPATMDAADELGMMVIVSNTGWQWFRPGVFVNRAYQGVREMVRWHRNHPSVILWEPILNETDYPEDFAHTVYNIVHEEYPGNQCYAAADNDLPYGKQFDVLYYDNDPPVNADRVLVAGKPRWVREWGDVPDNWTDQNSPGHARSVWGEAALLQQALTHARLMERQYALPGISGFGLWVGIDHQYGYHHNPFYGGILSPCRASKFSYQLFASQRLPDVHVPDLEDGPMAFIASYWNAFSTTDVTIFSNCERVRLFQDGKIIGEQSPDESPKIPHPPFTFRGLKFTPGHEGATPFDRGDGATRGWMPGELRAEGLIGGKVGATHTVRVAGVQTQLGLAVGTCGRPLVADGSDFIVVYASILDARSTVVPLADDLVHFEVLGEGEIIGDTSIGANPMQAQAGIAWVLIRSTRRPGTITVTAQAFGLKPCTVTFQSVPVVRQS